MLLGKNYQNRPMFHRVIQNIKVARFFIETVYMRYRQTTDTAVCHKRDR